MLALRRERTGSADMPGIELLICKDCYVVIAMLIQTEVHQLATSNQ